MSKLDFSLNLSGDATKIVNLATDFEKFPRYLPDQLKSMIIIERKNDSVTTKEELLFATVFKQQITQRSIHKKIEPNILQTEIIDGPAKGTIINSEFLGNGSGTQVNISIDLKLSIKYKILIPLIKKWYKMILTAILFKMNAETSK